jgi:SAM-dependent methyltransferase
MRNGWQEDYLNNYYRSCPGWVDGTTQFHELCRAYIRTDSRVCELGAGPSNTTSKLLSKVSGSVIGLDVDPSVVKNEFLDRAILYDGKAFPFSASSLDVVVADFVNEHLEDPLAMCAEINRVLVKGGIFIFRTPNIYHYVSVVARITPHWFHKLVANRLRNLPPDQSEPHPTYYRFNNSRRIHAILNSSGFNIVSLKFIEPNPSYGMSSRVLFILFMAYERLVNSTSLLTGLRSNILCVASKS